MSNASPSCETPSQTSTRPSAIAGGDAPTPLNERRVPPPRPTNPTATWYAVAGPNGDLTWRVESPAHVIGAKVHYVDEEEGMGLYWPNEADAFPWYLDVTYEDGATERIASQGQYEELARRRAKLRERKAVYPTLEGSACVWTRPLAWMAAHMIEMRNEHGVRVLAECDDNYLGNKRFNPFMQKAGWADDDADNHTRSICSGDGLIVSTEHLRDVYWKGLSKRFGKKIIPPIYVCRNHVDKRHIPTELVPPREDGKLRIGFMGSDSHLWDIDLIYPALAEAYINGHEIVFVGIHPHYSPIEPSKYLDRTKARWRAIEFTHIPWRNANYRGTALPLDIAFAPLVVDSFTLGKSDIKALEYHLSGAAPIVQNCLVYSRTLVHGETALMASSPQEFVLRMRQLIKDDKLRERLVQNGRQYIEEERMIEDHADEWKDAVFG